MKTTTLRFHSFNFLFFRRILLLIETEPSSDQYRIEWDHHYKEMKGQPTIKFQPNLIEITLKVIE